ncbi:MAG: hypothetical protein ACRDJH_02265 [Thermomicrobiales bacterium]
MAVEEYLAVHTEVLPLLSTAATYLRTAFPTDSSLVLDVSADYEGEGVRDLYVRIRTQLEFDDALERLARFNERWWRRASVDAPDSLHFTTEYV